MKGVEGGGAAAGFLEANNVVGVEEVGENAALFITPGTGLGAEGAGVKEGGNFEGRKAKAVIKGGLEIGKCACFGKLGGRKFWRKPIGTFFFFASRFLGLFLVLLFLMLVFCWFLEFLKGELCFVLLPLPPS